MKPVTRLTILCACLFPTMWLSSCVEDNSCRSDRDCDSPRQYCEPYTLVCADNPNYRPPIDGGHQPQYPACVTVADCPDRTNYDCTTNGCVPKKCYNDTDCQTRNDKGWICQRNVCVVTAPDPEPQVEFKLMLNADTANNLSSLWRAYLDPSKNAFEKSIVLLLCNPDDVMCNNPVLTRELTQDDGYTQALQTSYGPTIKLMGLPAGSYKMMIVADSNVSAKNGESWQQQASYASSWGGIVSDTDLMLAQGDDTNAPLAIDVTIEDGKTANLGTLKLGYFYQHDISPHPDPENGIIAVATGSGMRLIDLNTYSLIPSQEGTKKFDFRPVDEKGDPVSSKICTITKGYDNSGNPNVVWVITCDGKAYPFNIRTRKQIGSKYVSVGSPTPGMALAHYSDGNNFLFVQRYAGPENGGLNGQTYQTLWSGRVNDVLKDYDNVELQENKQTTANDDGLLAKYGAYKLIAYHNILFVQIYHTDRLANHETLTCGVDHVCVYTYYIDGKTGLLRSFVAEGGRKGYGKVDHIDAGPRLSDITSEHGEQVKCAPTTKTMQPKIGLGEYGDNVYLFVPRCLDTRVYKIDKARAEMTYDINFDEKCEMNDDNDGCRIPNGSPFGSDEKYEFVFVGSPNPKEPLQNHAFGQMLAGFYPSPDGKTLWAVPNDKSPLMLHAHLNNTDTYVTHNRLAAFPIDMTSKVPQIADGWTNTNVDNFEGMNTGDPLSKYVTPAEDPGLDLTAFYMKQHVLNYYPSSNGALSSLMFNGAKVAVANNTLWLIGHAHSDAKSSVGVFGDIAMYDIKSQKAVLNPQYSTDPFYKVFTYGGGAEQTFGYHLAETQSITALEIEYFNLDILEGVVDDLEQPQQPPVN